MLNFTTKTIRTLNVHDLEMFAKEYFHISVEIEACEEWDNDSTHYIDAESSFDDLDQEDWDDVLKTKGKSATYGISRLLLTAACIEGVLPKGEYTLEISY